MTKPIKDEFPFGLSTIPENPCFSFSDLEVSSETDESEDNSSLLAKDGLSDDIKRELIEFAMSLPKNRCQVCHANTYTMRYEFKSGEICADCASLKWIFMSKRTNNAAIKEQIAKLKFISKIVAKRLELPSQ